MKNFHKIMLFCSSYIPLFLLMLIKNFFERIFPNRRDCIEYEEVVHMIFSSELENWIFLIVLVISITSFLYLKWILKETEKTNHISYTICKAQNKSSEYFMNYIALYLLPCLGLSLENIVDVIVMVCVMCIIGYIYIQCDLIYMNPVLNMLGYKIFSVVLYDSSGGEIFETIAVVHKSVLLENNFSYKGTMNNGIIFMRKEHKND